LKSLVLPLALAIASIPIAAGAQEMRPGRYKTITRMEAPGRSLPPINNEDCVTKRDVDEGLARFQGDEESQCKASDIKRGAGTISYRMTCTEEGKKSTGEVNGKFTADSFDFNMVVNKVQTVKINVRGTRVGECK
jgi:hypothetical protein